MTSTVDNHYWHPQTQSKKHEPPPPSAVDSFHSTDPSRRPLDSRYFCLLRHLDIRTSNERQRNVLNPHPMLILPPPTAHATELSACPKPSSRTRRTSPISTIHASAPRTAVNTQLECHQTFPAHDDCLDSY